MKLGSAIGAGTPTEGAGGGSGAASSGYCDDGPGWFSHEKAIIRWPSLVDKHSYGNIYIYGYSQYISISQYIAIMADGYNFSKCCPYILPTHVQSCPLLCWRLAPHCGGAAAAIDTTNS